MTTEPIDRRPCVQDDANRSRVAIRLLQLAVMLRQRAWTLDELAIATNVVKRTVRRDLQALQAVPFPVVQDTETHPPTWRMIGPSPLFDGRR